MLIDIDDASDAFRDIDLRSSIVDPRRRFPPRCSECRRKNSKDDNSASPLLAERDICC
jgi:hypothetical protein